jgi:hypothetical protein
MKIDFSFRISSNQYVSQVVIAEAVAMFVGGSFLHHCSEVELSEIAHYRVEPAEGYQWSIQGSSFTEDIKRLLLAHYLLMAGFYKANFSIEYCGDHASWLPENGRLISTRSHTSAAPSLLTFPRLFREYLDSQVSNLPLSVVALEDLHKSLINAVSIKDLPESAIIRFASDTQMLVTFSGEISVELVVANERIESHRICGFTLGGITAESGLREEYPKEVRTWGEAWLAHDDSKASLLSGLLTLPSEVGVVTDRLYRYRIEEQETIKNRDNSRFGKGKSKVFDRGQWIRYASKYFELRSQTMVEACLNQAAQLSESDVQLDEMDGLRTDLKLYSLPRRQCNLLALDEIRHRSGLAVHARVVDVEKSRLEAFEYSDYGRQAWHVSEVSYTEGTPRRVVQAGFSREVFELLTGQASPQFLPESIPRLFRFDANNRRVWGHDSTGRYYVEEDPNTVFGS